MNGEKLSNTGIELKTAIPQSAPPIIRQPEPFAQYQLKQQELMRTRLKSGSRSGE